MKLHDLIQAQECGAFKVEEGSNRNQINIGGVAITYEQCTGLIKAIGWSEYNKQPWEIVDKTNKFIRGIKGHIDSVNVLNTTEVAFQNRRKQNTEQYFDRIKMVSPFFDITILYGMPGIGGTYAVYSTENNFLKPVFCCKTAKQLGEYINTLA